MAVSFTVVIPTHDRRGTLLLALASALEQTRPPGQVIVVADGCTDGTQDAVAALGDERVDVLDLPKGPGYGYAHRNEALRRARCDVVAWLRDDDLWLLDHLALVGELHDAGVADIVQATGCTVHADSSLEAWAADWRVPYFRAQAAVVGRAPLSTLSHRPGAALEAGGWDGSLEKAGDRDLWRRMLEAGFSSALVQAPSVLHFGAAVRHGPGREQGAAERAAQNLAFLARLRDPRDRVGLRSEMALALQCSAGETEAQLRDLEARFGEAWAELERVRAAQAELAAEHERTVGRLEAIEGGGWWRLRRRLLPLLRLARRGRDPN